MKISREELYTMPHPEPGQHKRMSLHNRASQFAPFAALTGYDEQIAETARTTDAPTCMAEDLREEIEQKLQLLFFSSARPEQAEITYFVPDLFKNGGRYVTVRGKITAANPQRRIITLENIEISIDDITDLTLY